MTRTRTLVAALSAAALSLSGLVLTTGAAGAAAFEVTSGLDDGSPGTLRWALAQATTSPGADVITVASTVPTVTLTDCAVGPAIISASGPVTIEGGGATVRQTCAGDGVLVGAGDATIRDLTITGGDAELIGGGIAFAGSVTFDGVTVAGNTSGRYGGGVHADQVVLVDSVIEDNHSQMGGGVYIAEDGRFTAERSTIQRNEATYGAGVLSHGLAAITDVALIDNRSVTGGGGGGIDARGPLTVTDSEVSRNVAAYGAGVLGRESIDITRSTIEANQGGGAYAAEGAMTLTDSTVAGNTAVDFAGVYAATTLTISGSAIVGNLAPDTAFGGGAFGGWEITVSNSTVTGNNADAASGVGSSGPVNLEYATIVGNTSSGQVASPTTVRSFGSVIAFGDEGDCDLRGTGTVVSLGHNLVGDGSCGFAEATDRNDAGDPQLSDLGLHGGTTVNHLPETGSPVLDAIPAGDARCAGVDQRGVPRPQDEACDIGSVEARQVSPPAIPSTTTSTSIRPPPGGGSPATPLVATPTFAG
jgi:hypothetical protein